MQIKLYLNAGKINDLHQGVQTAARSVLIKTKFEADWKPRPFFFRQQLGFSIKSKKVKKYFQ